MKFYAVLIAMFLFFQIPSFACKKVEKSTMEKTEVIEVPTDTLEEIDYDEESEKDIEEEEVALPSTEKDEAKTNEVQVKNQVVTTSDTKVIGQYEKPFSKEKEKEVIELLKEEVEKEEQGEIENEKVQKEKAEKEEVQKEEVEKADPFRNMHEEWASLLKSYVSADGKVDYQGFVNDRSHLEGYLAILANNPPQFNWSDNQKLAYWINTYNAFTVNLIVKNYPINSITDLHNGKPWDEKWIRIGGKSYSLNQIENEIIRPRFKEPRIHFAVNCAAVSCPPLSNKAYTADNIQGLLEEQTKSFLQNRSHNTITPGQLTLSKIFDWYKEDFGDIPSFVSKYTKVSVQPNAQITYKEYNWKLNGK